MRATRPTSGIGRTSAGDIGSQSERQKGLEECVEYGICSRTLYSVINTLGALVVVYWHHSERSQLKHATGWTRETIPVIGPTFHELDVNSAVSIETVHCTRFDLDQ